LGQILGLFAAAGPAVHESDDFLLKTVDQKFESHRVVIFDTQHQRDVWVDLGVFRWRVGVRQNTLVCSVACSWLGRVGGKRRTRPSFNVPPEGDR
jgi:hypothetical protein